MNYKDEKFESVWIAERLMQMRRTDNAEDVNCIVGLGTVWSDCAFDAKMNRFDLMRRGVSI